jgi:autonomous glycyl radical cofactor GrcA
MTEYNRRQEDMNIHIVADRISLLHGDITELKDSMKESMREMAIAVNKLVAVEIRQEAINQAYVQVTSQLEKEIIKRESLENRVDALEKDQPMTKQVVSWIMWGVGSIVVAAVTFIAKSVGFM